MLQTNNAVAGTQAERAQQHQFWRSKQKERFAVYSGFPVNQLPMTAAGNDAARAAQYRCYAFFLPRTGHVRNTVAVHYVTFDILTPDSGTGSA
jgi:hypothetical protein